MSSIQHEKKEVAVQLSAEQQANLDKMIKQAKQSYVGEDIVNRSRAIVAKNGGPDKAAGNNLELVTVLGGCLRSTTDDSLSILSSTIWDGDVVLRFPDPFKYEGFFSLAALCGGVKAGVAYAGKNKANVDCAWLIAFADNDCPGKVVYADCGPLSKFTNIDWAQIEAKVNKSSCRAYAFDAETGTSVYAATVGAKVEGVVAATFTG